MRKVLVVFVCGLLLIPINTFAAFVDIPVLGAGDGYWHNEIGTSYDYFDNNSDTVSNKYEYYGTSDTLQHNTGFTQFSLSDAPDVSDIVQVTLNINITKAWKTAPTSDSGFVKHLSNASNANGDASQKLQGNEEVARVDVGELGWRSFDVTSYVISDLNNKFSWSVFSFHPNAKGDYFERNAGFNFISAEGGNPAFLRFETSSVPLPPAFFLFGSGLAVLLCGKKRKI